MAQIDFFQMNDSDHFFSRHFPYLSLPLLPAQSLPIYFSFSITLFISLSPTHPSPSLTASLSLSPIHEQLSIRQ